MKISTLRLSVPASSAINSLLKKIPTTFAAKVLMMVVLCGGVEKGWGQTAQSIPYSFTSGSAALTSANGWSGVNVGTDYGDATTPIKFDATGKTATLFLASTPGALSYYLKGNNFSGGTFTISESDNGSTFSNLRTVTTLAGTSVQYTDAPASTTRYIRWTYTTKSSGNVGMGTIVIAAPSGTTPPTLTAAAAVTVDAAFNVTFPDNATWRSAITGITVGGTPLTAGYSISAGQITFTPSASSPANLLQTSGTKNIVVSATGYSNATVNQPIGAGVNNKLAIVTHPTAPASNGAVLATQPSVAITDQYGNATTSTATVTAAVGAGIWTIGGTINIVGISGTSTFTNLTATSAAAVTGATISFSSAGLTGITSNTFNIPAPPPANNLCGDATTLVFNDPSANGTLVNSTFTTPFSKKDVWFKFTPICTASHTVTVTGFTGDVDIELFDQSSSCPSTATAIAVSNTSGPTETISMSLIAGTTYYLRILAFDIPAESSVFTVAGSVSCPIDAPVANTATDITLNSFTANWGAVAGSLTYRLDVSTSPTFSVPAFTNIVLWNFPNATDDAVADGGIAANSAKTITVNGGVSGLIFTAAGASTNSANATNWDVGSGTKYWEVDFVTSGYNNVKVSSKQRGSNSAPRDFKLQYKIGPGGTYTDVPSGAIPAVANNYTSGVLSQLPLPAECDNQPSVYLRWIMTSNTSVNGGTVASAGSANIDDLIIEGNAASFVPGYENLTVAGTSQSITGLSANTTYYYRVRAVGGSSTSANSNVINVITYNDPATTTYRTKGSGNLSSTSIWEYNLTGSSYQDATMPPTSTNNVIIKNGHTLTMDQDFTVGSGKTFTMETTSNLVIATNATLTIMGNADFAAQQVTIKSNASGTGAIGKITGTLTGASNATVERYIPSNANRAWRLLAVPTNGAQTIHQAWQENQPTGSTTLTDYGTQITGPTGTGLDFVTPAYSMSTYNQAADSWTGVSSTAGSIATNTGYFIYIRGDRTQTPSTSITPTSATTLRTTGTLLQGPQTAITVPDNKYGLIGNVYASAIDLRNLIKSGIDNSIYVWDPKLAGSYNIGGYQTLTHNGTDYVVASPGGGSYGSVGTIVNTIQSGQAFFVHATVGGTGSVQLVENSKTTGSSSTVFFVNPNLGESLITSLYAVTAQGNELADGTLNMYNNIYSNNVDADDARKIANFSENFGMVRNGIKLSVEKKNLIGTTDTIYYQMNMLKQMNYHLEFTAASLNHPGLFAKLIDNHLNTSTFVDLDGTTAVNFTVNGDAGSSAANRFMLIFYKARPLPVTFTSIKANEQGSNIAVEWKVSNQLNIANYELEHSYNGVTYSTVNTQLANNATAATYNWLDANPAIGDHYYRVRSIGTSGQIKYSTTARVTVSKRIPVIAVYPNPVTNRTINVQFTFMEKGIYQIRLINTSGQVVMSRQLMHSGGSVTLPVTLDNNITAGSYQMEIIKPDNSRLLRQLLIMDK